MYQAQQDQYGNQPQSQPQVQGIPIISNQQLFPPMPINTNKSSCTVTTSKVFIAITLFFQVLTLLNHLSTGVILLLGLEGLITALYAAGANGFFSKNLKHAKIFVYGYAIFSVIYVIFGYIFMLEALEDPEVIKAINEDKKHGQHHKNRDSYNNDDEYERGYNFIRILQDYTGKVDENEDFLGKDLDNNENYYDNIENNNDQSNGSDYNYDYDVEKNTRNNQADLDEKIKKHNNIDRQRNDDYENSDEDGELNQDLQLTEEDLEMLRYGVLFATFLHGLFRGVVFLIYYTGYKQLLKWDKELEDFNIKNRQYQQQLQNNNNIQFQQQQQQYQPGQPNLGQQVQQGQYQNFQDEQNMSEDQGM